MKIEVIKEQPMNEDRPMYFVYQDEKIISCHYSIDVAKDIATKLFDGQPKITKETILTLEKP